MSDNQEAATGDSGNDFVANNIENKENDSIREAQEEEWRQELHSTEEDIMTLKQALALKYQRASELKRKLGISPLAEFTHNMESSVKAVRDSEFVGKMNQSANQLTARVGAILADLKTKPAIMSAEDKMSTTYDRVRRSRSVNWLKERANTMTEKTKANINAMKDSYWGTTAHQDPTLQTTEMVSNAASSDGIENETVHT